MERLTQKQIEVLDLLIQFKTSKEIARELGISPFAVDQRLHSAMRHIGGLSRRETANIYMALCSSKVS